MMGSLVASIGRRAWCDVGMTAAERLQPFIVAEHRRANGLPFDRNRVDDDPMDDPELLTYARAEVARLRATANTGRVLAEHDHESKVRCQAIERLLAKHEEAHA